MSGFVCAVDVGTRSARAGIFDPNGRLLGRSSHPIEVYYPAFDHAEHDSRNIWEATCQAVRSSREIAGVSADRISAIAFDATCSLVMRGAGSKQVSVSTTGARQHDTIAWLDHRAVREAEVCTRTGHEVLNYVGGVMSPEMQIPKLMWVKRNLPRSWMEAQSLFDLTDFLAWRACGATDRSQNTLTCKWTYLAHAGGWQPDFLQAVGLADLIERGNLPEHGSRVGASLGTLSPEAAIELGLTTRCVVGAGLIDAFAGALGVIGGYSESEIDRHIALIAGTSNCIMAFTPDERHVRGVWGPYYGATLPGYWVSEAGQSATGALLDHVIWLYGSGLEPNQDTHDRINEGIAGFLREHGHGFGSELHVLPDFHGNRSPFADPRARGVISGLTLDNSFEGLCRVYWRTAVALALGMRQILEHMNASRYRIDTLHITGGHVRSPILLQLYADATGCNVQVSRTEDAVLLGTAMVAAAAAAWYPDLASACLAMRSDSYELRPDQTLWEGFDRDYRVFLKMHEHKRELEALSSGSSTSGFPNN